MAAVRPTSRAAWRRCWPPSPAWSANGRKNAANVTLACTVDEEFTFLGVQRLAKDVKADLAVVAEPTQLQIVHSHKGVVRWHVHTGGRSCHSSSPEKGVNAIYRMGRLLGAIERYADQLRRTKIDPLLGPATLSVGRIEGGTSVNTVPDRCRIEVDRRIIPGEDPAQVSADFEQFLKSDSSIDFPFQVDAPWLASPALGAERSAELIACLGRAIAGVLGNFQTHGGPLRHRRLDDRRRRHPRGGLRPRRHCPGPYL